MRIFSKMLLNFEIGLLISFNLNLYPKLITTCEVYFVIFCLFCLPQDTRMFKKLFLHKIFFANSFWTNMQFLLLLKFASTPRIWFLPILTRRTRSEDFPKLYVPVNPFVNTITVEFSSIFFKFGTFYFCNQPVNCVS